MAKVDPTAARAAFLDKLTPEEQNSVLRRADRTGPAKDDADWLVALAVSKAAERIEAAVAEVEEKSGTGRGHSCRSSTPDQSISLVIWAVAISLGIFVGITEFVIQFSSAHLQEVAVYAMALAIGIGGSAIYASAAPYFIKRSSRRR